LVSISYVKEKRERRGRGLSRGLPSRESVEKGQKKSPPVFRKAL
jgi:hypothetical protein